MRKLIAPFTAIAVLTLAQAAAAEEISGKVQAMDVPSRTILLDDGNAYVIGEGVAMDALKPGTEVKVSFEEKNGQRVATEVKPAK